MQVRCPNIAPAISGILAVLVLLPLLYVCGYFGLADTIGISNGCRIRMYGWQWAATIYEPAARVESAVADASIVVIPVSQAWQLTAP